MSDDSSRSPFQVLLTEEDRAMLAVVEERRRQDDKWGRQDHSPAFWMLILGEEFGEAQKAALEASWIPERPDDVRRAWAAYRRELVQVAAVAIAAVESFDRNGPPPRQGNALALGVDRHA